jgi:hypothetical protein
MKIRLVFSLLILCGAASAQYTRGYAYVAPGGVSAAGNTERSYAVGGGVERLLAHGVGAGAELGAFLPSHAFKDNVHGVFSLNGYYHFLSERALDPFATAGYSLIFRDDTANMFNFGGGVNYWFQEKLGLQLEFRDHVRHHDANSLNSPAGSVTANYWNFRIGLTFR